MSASSSCGQVWGDVGMAVFQCTSVFGAGTLACQVSLHPAMREWRSAQRSVASTVRAQHTHVSWCRPAAAAGKLQHLANPSCSSALRCGRQAPSPAAAAWWPAPGTGLHPAAGGTSVSGCGKQARARGSRRGLARAGRAGRGGGCRRQAHPRAAAAGREHRQGGGSAQGTLPGGPPPTGLCQPRPIPPPHL